MEEELKLDPEQQQIYDSAPGLPSRSRLEPHRNLILRWRRQGRSYRQIRQLLSEKCAIEISYLPLYEFVQRRSRPRKPVQPEPEPQAAIPMQPVAVAPPGAQQATSERKRLTPEEKAAQVAFLRALREKPVVVPDVDQKPRFEYDETKPLILIPKQQGLTEKD